MLRYYQHFGLQRDPFLDTPDPQFYVEAPVVRQDLRAVLTGIDEAQGATVVIGAPGAGKTSLFTKVEQVLLSDDTAIVGKIFEPTFSSDVELLASIARVFGLRIRSRSTTELTQALKNFMLDRVAVEQRTVVLLIDEAHEINPECLETLRFLHNLRTPEHRLLTLVLFGRPRLAQVLGGRGRFNDRTDRHIHLAALDAASSAAIIEYRLLRAGKEPPVKLITPPALGAAVAAGGGIPRTLIEIVRASMIEAAHRGADAVAGDHVAAALRARTMRRSGSKRIAAIKPWRFGAAEAPHGAADLRQANISSASRPEMKLAGKQRESGRVPTSVAGSTTYTDRPDSGHAVEAPRPSSGAILVTSIEAQPRSALIPGALVTISLSIVNDGDVAAGNVRVTLPLPLNAAYRPGTLVVDGLSADNALAEQLFTNGALLGDIASGARRRLCVALLIESGLDDITLSPYVSAASAAVLGPRAVRLSRAVPVPGSAREERAFEERPFYEVDDEEDAYRFATAGRKTRFRSVSIAHPSPPNSGIRQRLEKAKTVKSHVRRRTLAPSEPAVRDARPAPALSAAAFAHAHVLEQAQAAVPPPDFGVPVARAAEPEGPRAGDARVTLLARHDAPRTARHTLEPPAEQSTHPVIEVVRSVERYVQVEPVGGPVLTVRIDRKRLRTLSGLFGGKSLGMIAHYLVLNALAVHQPLPGDSTDESLAGFVAQQEQLLSRALVATRLGKTPAPESVAAPLPVFPTSFAPRSELCEIETPALGSALLVRAFEATEVKFVERMLANDGAAPFMRAAQLFVGLCAADVAVADERLRRSAAQALKAYSSLASAEINRIFLRAKLSSAPDLFKSTDARFDDAARTVLVALGHAIG